jgi:hypothetical protein
LFYLKRIVNLNKSELTAIRFTKFSIGNFNKETRHCENSWLEIKETNYPNDNLFVNEMQTNLTSDFGFRMEKSGKYCGNLFNFLSSFYSSKSYLIITYQRLIDDSSTINENLDAFEIEITFHDKNLLSPQKFAKNNYSDVFVNLNKGTEVENSKCNHLFTSCTNQKYDACIISSPNFPGTYLKNFNCQYEIKINEDAKKTQNQKLILVNDNFQVDGELCHPVNTLDLFQPTGSYFCDKGPRSENECADFINIYGEINKRSDASSLVKNVCGIGRLPKIVTENSLLIEFISSSDGFLANTGFLFYAMNQKKYFENYHNFTRFDSNQVSNPEELNSIIALEMLQVENCDSSEKDCLITFNEAIINQIYPALNSSE